MLEQLEQAIENFGAELAWHGLAGATYIVLFFAIGPLLRFFNKGKDIEFQVRMMKAALIVIFIMHFLDLLLVSTFPDYENYFVRIGYSVAAVFGCLTASSILSYFNRQKFGIERKIEEERYYFDTYNSRLVDLITYVVLALILVYSIIKIWDLDSLLETTGLIGIIFVFLGLTNSIWAPDIYFGMVILNSNMLEDGDVVKISGYSDEYIISRVTLIYTILLDVRNNHRVLLRNSQLINQRVDNLSKRASADGLRYTMDFNIGYPARQLQDLPEGDEARRGEFDRYRGRIKQMFELAQERILINKEIKVNRNIPFEVVLRNSGDYALTFSLAYYLEAIPNTRVTKTIRQYLTRTPSLIQEAVNQAAIECGVMLATPVLIDNNVLRPEKPTSETLSNERVEDEGRDIDESIRQKA